MRFFSTLVLTAITAALALSAPGTKPLNAQNSEQLGIEINTNLHDKPLYLPVRKLKEGKGTLFATVPVKSAGGVTALRIIPRMTAGQVKADVYFIYDDYSKIKSCEDLKSLRHKLAGTHYLGLKDIIKVKDEAAGDEDLVTIEGVPLRLQFLTASYAQDDYPCGCAHCGKPPNELACCPKKGKCLTCSDCGLICCPPVGWEEELEL